MSIIQTNLRMHSIGTRLTVAFLIVLGLLLMQGWFGLSNVRRMKTNWQAAMENEKTLGREAVDKETGLKDRMLRLVRFRELSGQTRIKLYTLTASHDPDKFETLKKEIESHIDTLVRNAPNLGVPVELVEAGQSTYKRIIELHWNFQSRQAGELLNGESQKEYEALHKTLEDKTRELDSEIKAMTQKLEADMQKLQTETQTNLEKSDKTAKQNMILISALGVMFAGIAGGC